MSPASTRVLVTGATGFLGGNVLAALQARPEVEAVAACRTPQKLPPGFTGEVRVGDLEDPGYRRDVVEGVDVLCHAASTAALWGHAELERRRFFEPTRDLVEQAIGHNVKRVITAGTVVMASPSQPGRPPLDDFAPAHQTGFWPHLDRLIEIDRYLQANCHRGTQMAMLRLGHFVGAGNRLGVVPALVPRLRTRLVPWLARGRRRVPLIADSDLGEAFALAAVAPDLADYESFNICGPEFPTLREVVEFMADETGSPRPRYSVTYPLGYAFGWLTETLQPILPGSSPFLTRSIVHLCEHWVCSTDHARAKLGFVPRKDWRIALREQLQGLEAGGRPWPSLSQFA